MSRCGCGDSCTCNIQVTRGLTKSGNGNANNPMIIGVDGEALSGPGIGWNGTTLTSRLSPGGGLEFDTSGAMKVTGESGGGGGGGFGGPTISDLEKHAPGSVIGGQCGAGYMFAPECLMSSYRLGSTLGMDLMMVPVRFLSDGTPVSYMDEGLGRTAGSHSNQSYWQTQAVQEQTPERWQQIITEPGYWNPRQAWQPAQQVDPVGIAPPPSPWNGLLGNDAWSAADFPSRAPSHGWFGYLADGQRGLTFLADILREVGGHTPLLLDLMWPRRDPNYPDQFLNPTPAWRTELFLLKTVALIKRLGLANYVVVVTHEIEIPPNSGTAKTNVPQRFLDAGIHAGPTFGNASKYPPDDTWPKGWTWAHLSINLGADTIKKYVDHGIHVIVSGATRHNQWKSLVNDTGARGGVSADPVYTAAVAPLPIDHPLVGGAFYRRGQSHWEYNVVDHGLFPAYVDPSLVKSPLRGHCQVGADLHYLDPEMRPDFGIVYWVLQGWMCPLPAPTNWSLNWTWQFDQVVGDAGHSDDDPANPRNGEWLALAFSVPTDHDFRDWWPGSPPDPTLRPNDTGYRLLMSQTGYLELTEYDQGKGTVIGTGTTLSRNMAGVAKQFRLGINPKGIRLRAVANDGMHDLITVTTDVAQKHRGEYVYVGRCSPSNPSPPWYGWFGMVNEYAGGGTNDGPQ